MKYIYLILLTILLSIPAFLYSSQKKDPDYEFIQKDTYYSFRGSIIVKADIDSLINKIYDFKNLSEYSSGARSIELVRQGVDWYEMIYTYRKLLILENKSTWRRTLKRDKNKIIFEMISSNNNLNIVPEVLSSSGYYLIRAEKDGCRVEYFQECRLNRGLLKNIYINRAKKEAVKFLKVFENFLNKTYD